MDVNILYVFSLRPSCVCRSNKTMLFWFL